MFQAVSEKERYNFWTNSADNFIPGYTGHCPTLRFQYGRSYGTNTKEILTNLREKEFYHEVHRHRYEDNPTRTILTPLTQTKNNTTDLSLDSYKKCPKYILGYTGFIPTLNFRYGKSFGRTADDSAADFAVSQSKVRQMQADAHLYRAKSAPKMAPLRKEEEVRKHIAEYEDKQKFKDKELSADYPPIAGYTGHIPRVKGNEESLSQRYNTVVRRGLTLMREDREKRKELLTTAYKIHEIINEGKPRYTYIK